ncbi:hypothetical protein OPW13_07000 [Vibrio europaeus]|uniref:Uncharacterized protein n=1 Tax=Vibrio europaeus TaxID=300876 RepID=A0A178JAB3_9VIBR|nr:hypothetical protein [Vibrio europaeus]MDC5704753.1 hypothetical protein [Vibrio europaeus]MDC5710032.1 hypothetical protein [Vibrio europaeus]MDC5715122.1 hypothetical protein [Vibrio europaeus]MDC5719024.1 hypothetical protein [Vibrio europaeus]MDC5844146.1 hypothetical protein [Vibrio europaeus]
MLSAEQINKLIDKGVEYILQSPTLLSATAVCYITGHLLFFVIVTYGVDKSDSKTYLNGVLGKLGLGMLWHAFVTLPVYWIEHKVFAIEYSKLIDTLPTSMIIGLVLQAICITIYISCRKGGK